MAGDAQVSADFEVSCLVCGKALTEDDDIHVTFGPFGFDFDVLCAACAAAPRGSAGEDGLAGLMG